MPKRRSDSRKSDFGKAVAGSPQPPEQQPVPQKMTGRGLAPDLQSLLVWPLFVGGGVLAIAWTAWEMLTGKKDIGGGVSLAASGLATFAVGVFAVTVLLNIWASAFKRFGAKYPRFLTLDWMVPIGVVFGFVLGLAIWR